MSNRLRHPGRDRVRNGEMERMLEAGSGLISSGHYSRTLVLNLIGSLPPAVETSANNIPREGRVGRAPLARQSCHSPGRECGPPFELWRSDEKSTRPSC